MIVRNRRSREMSAGAWAATKTEISSCVVSGYVEYGTICESSSSRSLAWTRTPTRISAGSSITPNRPIGSTFERPDRPSP